MKVKTMELTGKALGMAVFLVEGHSYWLRRHAKFDVNHGYTDWVLDSDGVLRKYRFDESCSRAGAWMPDQFFEPSVDWESAGQIIDRELISIMVNTTDGPWFAQTKVGHFVQCAGPNGRVAALRCHVMRRFGDEVDLPEEVLP